LIFIIAPRLILDPLPLLRICPRRPLGLAHQPACLALTIVPASLAGSALFSPYERVFSGDRSLHVSPACQALTVRFAPTADPTDVFRNCRDDLLSPALSPAWLQPATARCCRGASLA
jgi:hypothetical protein